MADHNCLSNGVFASTYIPLVLPYDCEFNNSCDWIFCLTLAHELTHMLEQEGGHTFTHAHIRVTFLAGVKSRDCSRVHSSWNTSNTLPVCQRNHKGLDTHTHTHTCTETYTRHGSTVSESVCESHLGYAASWFYNSRQHGTVFNILNNCTVGFWHKYINICIHCACTFYFHTHLHAHDMSFGPVRLHKWDLGVTLYYTADESEGERRDSLPLCVSDL